MRRVAFESWQGASSVQRLHRRLQGVSVEKFFSDRAVDVLIVVGLPQGAGFGFFPGAALYARWSLWLGFRLRGKAPKPAVSSTA